MSHGLDRRSFLKAAAGLLAAAGVPSLLPGAVRAAGAAPALSGGKPVVAVARGGAPADLVRRAVGALGGMGTFVRSGDVVVVKPNIGWDRTPELAANTDPDVVKEVVRLCVEAGAKRVRVLDRTCNEPRRCYRNSGIQEAVESLRLPQVSVEHSEDRKYVEKALRDGATLRSWTFHRDVLEADRVINVPVAKHHNAARLTMGLKNVMGVLGGNRGNIHHDLDRNIADLNTVFRFDLTVLDAVKVLVANGPQGGRAKDVRRLDTVAAGTDPVAVDSFGATLFGITGRDVPHVLYAHQRGLGEIDLSKVVLAQA